MKLSIIIPCYNEQSTIKDIINKVNSQSNIDKEIIVVDDGSDDKTYDLLVKSELLDMRGQLPNIRYLDQHNEGVSAARNHLKSER